jgi:hypothetical protein
MIMVSKKTNLLVCVLTFCIIFGLAACAGMSTKPSEPIVKYNVAPEAEVTNFEYFLDEKCKIAKKPCLTFKMTVKNISSEPLRFISKITLPKEGKSVGGFIPRKGAKDKVTKKRGPAVIAPGKAKTVSYPAFHYEIPQVIEVEVTAMK